MFDHVIIGQYIPGQSFVHRLDPRAKLAGVFVFLIFLFLARDPLILAGAFAMTAAAFWSANIPLSFYLKGMRFIAIIILFTFFLHLFMTREGTVVLDFGVWQVYSGGLIEGGLIAFRLVLLITMASMLTLTTTPVDLTDGMERLMKPLAKLNVPTHELALMMSIALRFIPTLLGETSKIVKAQMARGANFAEGSIWKRMKAFIPVLVPLFIQSFKRAEDLATAMEARGYAGGTGRTKYRQMTWKRSDSGILALFILFAVLTVTERFFI